MYCEMCGAEHRDNAEFCSNCGQKLVKPRTTPGRSSGNSQQAIGSTTAFIRQFIGAVSPRHEIIRELGRGGMAIVFLAKDTRLDRLVALKLLPENFQHDEHFRERFLREARVAARLSHPNIVQIHDVKEVGEFTYYSMSFIQGAPLNIILKKNGALAPKVVAKLGLHICFALQHAHEQGVIHRDIKPENIIITQKRQPIVVDFGIAKALAETNISQTGMLIGTPHYMSPEQITTGKVDGRSDIYSLGCVLYEMATGHPPFHSKDPAALMYHHVNELPPAPHEMNPAVSMPLSDLIMQAIAKKPDNRFQSAAELGTALHNTVIKEPAAKQPTAPTRPTPATLHPTPAATDIPPTLVSGSGMQPETGSPPPHQKSNDTIPAVGPDTPTAPPPPESPREDKRSMSPLLLGLGIGMLLTALGISGWAILRNIPELPPILHNSAQPSSSPGTADPLLSTMAPKSTTSSTPEQPDEPSPPQGTVRAASFTEPQAPKTTTPPRSPEPTPVSGTGTSSSTPDRRTSDDAVSLPVSRPSPPPITPTRTASLDVPAQPAVTLPPTPDPPVSPGGDSPETVEKITWMYIPGGVFMMGDSQGDIPADFQCVPVHRVTLSAFEMSRDEITVAQYAVFLRATGHTPPPQWETQAETPSHPVVFVTWGGAAAFAQWADARLPTEAEWEYAARGGIQIRRYPWGDANPTGRANFGNEWNNGDGWRIALKPVGTYPPNGYGLNDMAGNVWEWCSDWFGPYVEKQAINPAGAAKGSFGRTVRGGGWNSGTNQLMNAMRGPLDPTQAMPHIGFRIVRGGVF